MNSVWTKEENQFIQRYSGQLTDEQLARAFMEKFDRTMNTEQVRKQRQRLGIKKKHGRGICMVDFKKGK